MIELTWWSLAALGLAGLSVGCAAHAVWSKMRIVTAKQNAKMIAQKARSEADNIIKDSKIAAKDEVLSAREKFEQETETRRAELSALEKRILQKESNLDKKVALLNKKEQGIEATLDAIDKQRDDVNRREEELTQLIAEKRKQIQHTVAMSEEEAEKRARKIITLAIERYAAPQVNEITTCSVPLPSDELKGRIIGKEGRNIRSLEAATGVNILIDDTPEVVVISGFDPLRREIARITLERLIKDGCVHPARIEEVVAKVRNETDQAIRTAGEQAIYELGLRGVAPELVRTIGRLKFRHSYSQNVLKHSIEHDIGKAFDH